MPYTDYIEKRDRFLYLVDQEGIKLVESKEKGPRGGTIYLYTPEEATPDKQWIEIGCFCRSEFELGIDFHYVDQDLGRFMAMPYLYNVAEGQHIEFSPPSGDGVLLVKTVIKSWPILEWPTHENIKLTQEEARGFAHHTLATTRSKRDFNTILGKIIMGYKKDSPMIFELDNTKRTLRFATLCHLGRHLGYTAEEVKNIIFRFIGNLQAIKALV